MGSEKLKILLADDDMDDRLLFEDALDEIPVKSEVKSVKDGVELMEYLRNENGQLPNLLFLDLNMPRMGGIDCLKEIRKDAKLKELCVAIYSTSSSEQDIENTFVQGANVYIKKPNDFKTLKKALKKVLELNWHYEYSGLNRENFLLSI